MRRLISCFVIGLGTASAHAQVVADFPNQTYAMVGGRPLQLDVYLPDEGTGPFPCVIRIHGGGWQSGSRAPLPGTYAGLLQSGIAVASVSYRLTSQAAQWGGEPVTFPAQIHDVKAAARFLRARSAIYNLDPRRFGAWGTSAGGHLAGLLGTSGGASEIEGIIGGNLQWSSRLQAFCPYFGPTDIININLDVTTPPGSGINHDAPTSAESRLVGWDDPGQGIGDIRANLNNPNAPYPGLVTLCNWANPVFWASADDPPAFIAHGTNDTTVPLAQSTRLHLALEGFGVFNDYREVPGAGHGNLGSATDTAATQFFIQRLRDAALPACPGDADGSGEVDFSDIAVSLAAFGGPGGPQGQGDADGNGTVNFADVTSTIANWGDACP